MSCAEYEYLMRDGEKKYFRMFIELAIGQIEAFI